MVAHWRLNEPGVTNLPAFLDLNGSESRFAEFYFRMLAFENLFLTTKTIYFNLTLEFFGLFCQT